LHHHPDPPGPQQWFGVCFRHLDGAVGGDSAAGAGQELNYSDAAMGAQTHRAARPEFAGTQFLALAVQFEDPEVRAGAAAALEPALAARKVYFEVDPLGSE
jgi:hypothetical protein